MKTTQVRADLSQLLPLGQTYSTNQLYGGAEDYNPATRTQDDFKNAFSGVDGLTSAKLNPDGTYSLYKGGSGPYNDYEATAKVGSDGTVQLGDWKERNLTTNAQALGQFGLGTAGMFAGLGALGQGPLAGLFGNAAPAGVASEALANPITLGGGGASLADPITLAGATAGDAGVGSAGSFGTGFGGGMSPSLLGALPAASQGVSSLLSGLKNVNPSDLLKVGGLLGAVGGGMAKPDEYSGPMPTISRGNFQASVTPQYAQVNPNSLLQMPQKKTPGSGLWQFLGQ